MAQGQRLILFGMPIMAKVLKKVVQNIAYKLASACVCGIFAMAILVEHRRIQIELIRRLKRGLQQHGKLPAWRGPVGTYGSFLTEQPVTLVRFPPRRHR